MEFYLNNLQQRSIIQYFHSSPAKIMLSLRISWSSLQVLLIKRNCLVSERPVPIFSLLSANKKEINFSKLELLLTDCDTACKVLNLNLINEEKLPIIKGLLVVRIECGYRGRWDANGSFNKDRPFDSSNFLKKPDPLWEADILVQ